MALTKKTKTDKIETVAVLDHYVLQCRERMSVMEGNSELSASFHRYTLQPNSDVSKITDPVILAQFNAIMTKEVKDNYAKFVKEQEQSSESE